MLDLTNFQLVAIALVFLWSGFVRTGLGFGGALLSMPFLLLIDNRPLIYLPIIAVQLLFFVGLTFIEDALKKGSFSSVVDQVDWRYLRRSAPIMIIPKIIGVAGLIVLPNVIMSTIIFAIVLVYALSYMTGKEFRSTNPWLDRLFLALGAYISGTSLIGAPLLVAVFSQHVTQEKLRSTLFALWFILVLIKMVGFVIAGVDLQLVQHLWLLPAAWIGHSCGKKFHQLLIQQDRKTFFRYIGIVLLLSSTVGIVRELIA